MMAFENTAGGRGGAHGTGLTMDRAAAVGHRGAMAAAALDGAFVAVALADAGDVDFVADCENACLDLVADVHLGGFLNAEFLEVLLEGNFCLLEMAELRLGQLGFLDVLKAKLYGVVAVFLGGLLLGHDAGACLNDSDRNDLAALIENLGHAHFFADDCFLHLHVCFLLS